MSEPVVGVVGLGLIGGSLARGLAARGLRVLGHDRDSATLERALDAGVVDAPLGPALEHAGTVDWLVLAVPVDQAGDMLRTAVPHVGNTRLVTDVGSTKRAVMDAARESGLGERFVGSHPFAGDHRTGWAVSRADLFAGETVFLCPTAETSAAALAEAQSLWSLCGARTSVMDAAEHDRIMAWASHLPQILSSAFAVSLDDRGLKHDELGRGARDMLRLAASDPRIWSGIATENADNLIPALLRCEQALAGFRTALAAGDRSALHALLARGSAYTASS